MYTICLINQYAGNPQIGMEYRPFHLGKEWIKSGHEVLIIASNYAHIRKGQFKLPWYKIYSKINVSGVDFLILRGIPYEGNGIFRALGIILFGIHAALAVLILRKFDAYIASSTHTLDFLPIAVAKYFKKPLKLVFEPHDLWPLTLTAGGHMSIGHPFVRLLQLGEDLLLKLTDIVVSMHPYNYLHLRKRGLGNKPFYHIPNGIALSEHEVYQTESVAKCEISSFVGDKDLTIVYAGAISAANGLDQIINAMDLCAQNNLNVGLLVFGGGNAVDTYKNKLETSENIYFGGRIDREELASIYQLVDVGYCGFNASALYEYGISPNKLWEYMYYALPILLMVDSPNDPVTEAKAGITVTNYRSEDLFYAIKKFLALKRNNELNHIGQNGKIYVIKNNTYEILAQQFLEILEFDRQL